MPQLCESYKDIWFAIRWKDKFLVESDKNIIRDEKTERKEYMCVVGFRVTFTHLSTGGGGG